MRVEYVLCQQNHNGSNKHGNHISYSNWYVIWKEVKSIITGLISSHTVESALFKGINFRGLPKNLLPLIHMTVFLHCNETNKMPKKTSPNKAA